MPESRAHKVLKLRIVKPVNMGWDELGEILRQVRYRVWRLANLRLSETYSSLAARESTTELLEMVKTVAGEGAEDKIKKTLAKKGEAILKGKLSALNRRLRAQLAAEAAVPGKNAGKPKVQVAPERLCDGEGALMSYVTDALESKLGAETKGEKWKQTLKGERALPTYRRTIPIPLRGGWNAVPSKRKFTPLRKESILGTDEVVFEPRLCKQPWPKVIVSMPEKDSGGRAVLNRLLDNPDQCETGHRQRSFELVQDQRDNRWYLHLSYDFPVSTAPNLDPDKIVGVDVGFSCPLYAALCDNPKRLGEQEFGGLGKEIRRLRLRTVARRRELQRAGKRGTEDPTRKPARSGHGVTRKMQPTDKLQGRIDNAQKTLNHRMSAAVIKFALDNQCGAIQVEDLSGLREKLTGTFLGMNWRYFELLQFIDYKARAANIKFRKVAARYTSRRCSSCGWIDGEFSRQRRDDVKRKTGKAARFICCGDDCEAAWNRHHKDFANSRGAHADHNAAQNLATPDIENLIRQQCELQGIAYDDARQEDVDSLTTETEVGQSDSTS